MIPEKVLVHTVKIEEPDYPSGGGRSPKYTEIASNVKARIEKLSGRPKETVLGQFPTATHKMFLNPGPDVKTNCRVICGQDEYKVLDAIDWFGSHLELILEEMVA